MKTSDQKTHLSVSKYPLLILAILLALFLSYYLVTKAYPRLLLAQDSFGGDYLRRLSWIVPHTLIGILAVVIGPVQFIPQIKNHFIKTFKGLGRIYVITSVIGGITGMVLAVFSDLELPYSYSVGLFMLCFTWTITSAMAYFTSKNKEVELHREWMIRSYIIALAFVSFRFIIDILVSVNIGGNADPYAIMSWVVPLLLAEIIISWNKNLP